MKARCSEGCGRIPLFQTKKRKRLRADKRHTMCRQCFESQRDADKSRSLKIQLAKLERIQAMTTQNGSTNGGSPNDTNTMLVPVGDAGGLRKLVSNDRVKDAIGDVISKYVTPDKLFKLTILAATQNPTLFQCTRESIIQSMMVAGQMGLEISPTQGHLVPYNKKIKERGRPDRFALAAQFIPDYRGLILLAKRAGAITKAEARLVYVDDEFKVDYGEDKIVHVADIRSTNRSIDDCVAVYFRVKFPDGDHQFEVMTFDEVNDIRERCSKAAEGNAWKENFGEMAKKTVTKRGLKYIAVDSPELAAAIEHDNRIETGQITSVNEILDTVDSVASRMAENTANKQDELRERLQAEAAAKVGNGNGVGSEGRKVPDWERRTLENTTTEQAADPSSQPSPLFTSLPVDGADPKRMLVINGVRTPFLVLAQNGRDRAKGETLDLMADLCMTIGVKLADELDTICKARPEELSQQAANMIRSFLQGRAEMVMAEKKKRDAAAPVDEEEDDTADF